MLAGLGILSLSLAFASLFEGWLCGALERAEPHSNRTNFGWLAFGLSSAVSLPAVILLWILAAPGLALLVPLALLGYFSLHELLHWNHCSPRADGKPRALARVRPVRTLVESFETRQALHALEPAKNRNSVLPLYDLVTHRYTLSDEVVPAALRYKKTPRAVPVRYWREA